MITYKDAGVDVEAGYEAVRLMKDDVKSTHTPGVLNALANFGGLFELDASFIANNPVLVSGADGVGTKLKLAIAMKKHDTIGIDCVAMCVNDIACLGAKPLFFLDYIAQDKLDPIKVAQIVKGMTVGCRETGCALIGGETAEMPGMYNKDEYDVAGFAVGIVDKEKIIDGSKVEKGDVLVGIGSSGLHSNGFSLVRRLFYIDSQSLSRYVSEITCTMGEELLRPTKLYVKPLLNLINDVDVHGVSNITGGGFIENIPRMLKGDMGARIELGSWDIKPIFDIIKKKGELDNRAMFNTFNMGIGMIVAVSKDDADKAVESLNNNGCSAYIIGEVTTGNSEVELCGKE